MIRLIHRRTTFRSGPSSFSAREILVLTRGHLGNLLVDKVILIAKSPNEYCTLFGQVFIDTWLGVTFFGHKVASSQEGCWRIAEYKVFNEPEPSQ